MGALLHLSSLRSHLFLVHQRLELARKFIRKVDASNSCVTSFLQEDIHPRLPLFLIRQISERTYPTLQRTKKNDSHCPPPLRFAQRQFQGLENRHHCQILPVSPGRSTVKQIECFVFVSRARIHHDHYGTYTGFLREGSTATKKKKEDAALRRIDWRSMSKRETNCYLSVRPCDRPFHDFPRLLALKSRRDFRLLP